MIQNTFLVRLECNHIKKNLSKRYTTGGYKPVGKNKRMDQSNKRSGDSKAQHRELHKDLAKYGHTKTGKASNLKSGLKSFKESAWQRKGRKKILVVG